MTSEPVAANGEPSRESVNLADALRELVDILPGLKAVIERRPLADRMTLRLDEVADSLGMSRCAIERERSAGRFPPPDLHIGKAPLWRPETIHNWLNSRNGGR